MKDKSRKDRRLLKELHYNGVKWTRLVDRHANSKKRITFADSHRYKLVYGQMMKICEELVDETFQNEQDRETIRRFSALVGPWSSPRAIHDAPKAIVKDLLAQHRRLECEITGTSPRSAREWFVPTLIALLVALTSVVVFTVFMFSVTGSEAFWLQNLSNSVVNKIAHISLQGQLGLMAIMAWIFGTIVIWSALRR